MATGIAPSRASSGEIRPSSTGLAPEVTRPTNVGPAERWASIIGGGALALYGISKATFGSMALALAGGALAYRGITGHSQIYQRFNVNTMARGTSKTHSDNATMQFAKSVTIDKPAADLYAYWHDFTHLPTFMQHLDSVTATGNGRSHWTARIPANNTVEWDAEITEDRPNEVIKWRSLPDAQVHNDGEVRFIPAPGGRGTEVHVTIRYDVPGGIAGKTLARLANVIPAQQVKDDVRRFKELMESGEIPTTEGQPAGR